MKTVIAIVGSPNVGKSTLFNRLIGKRKALVSDIPGLTRDRNNADFEWLGKDFSLVDTGGIGMKDDDNLTGEIRRQAELAVEGADIVLFMVDAQKGIIPFDNEISRFLRRVKKKIILVVNKVDHISHETAVNDFWNLGMGEPIPISSSQGLNIDILLDLILKHIPEESAQQTSELSSDDEAIKIAIIGKPNVGKSTLVNTLLNEDRVIVTDRPHTTRDAIDIRLESNGNSYILIDTAGIRHKWHSSDIQEVLCFMSTKKSIERADIMLIMFDAQEGITEQDQRIAGMVAENNKACMILVNKWDLIKKDDTPADTYINWIKSKMKFLHYAPVLFISAKTKRGVHKILPNASILFKNYSKQISENKLQKVTRNAYKKHPIPPYRCRQVKIIKVRQTGSKPPTITIFVTEPKGVHFSYRRYMENMIRDAFGFSETPLKLKFRKGEKK